MNIIEYAEYQMENINKNFNLIQYVLDEMMNIEIGKNENIDYNRLKTFFEFVMTKIQQLHNMGPRKNSFQESQFIVLKTARDEILKDIKLKKILGIID